MIKARQSYVKSPLKGVALPQGEMTPIGYVLMQHAERLGRPTKAYEARRGGDHRFRRQSTDFRRIAVHTVPI
jgi:hypothetical protein